MSWCFSTDNRQPYGFQKRKKSRSNGRKWLASEWRHQVNDVISEVKQWHNTAKEAQTFYLDVSWSIFSD